MLPLLEAEAVRRGKDSSVKLFNSLTRHKRYKFHLADGSALYAIFHQYLPDGCLLVSGQMNKFPGETAHSAHLNPAQIIAAWEVSE